MRKDAPIISCFHVTIESPDGSRLLDDVTLELNFGAWNEVTGPPRAGKSILFDVLSLRGIPRRGKLVVDGRNLDRASAREIADVRRLIGSCSEDPRLLNDRTVCENLVLPFVVRGDRARALHAAEGMLEALDMSELRDVPVHQLCRRDRIMVGIARAMVGKPAAILIDGAHELLDDRARQVALQQLKRRNSDGTTVVLFGHDTTDNARRGRQFRLVDGSLEECERPGQIPRVPEAGGPRR